MRIGRMRTDMKENFHIWVFPRDPLYLRCNLG